MKLLTRLILATIAVSLLSLAAVAQEKKITARAVPAAVIQAFKTAYPNATIRGYAREKEDGKVFYEIESREGDMSRDVLYNPDGTVAELEESVAVTDLPAEAQETLHTKYPKAAIAKAERTTAGDKVTYEVHLKQGRKLFAVEFDSSGQVLKKTGK
jgi:Putative beta-lactamase-inhibitor-like, PepSY-like